MSLLRFSHVRVCMALTALALLASPALQLRAQEKTLPKGEDILQNYVKVTGGEDAYRKHKTRVSTGTVEFEGAGITGKLQLFQEAPNKMVTILEIENIGTITQGTDGKIAWEINPLTGERLLEGDEKANFLREAEFYGEVEWKKQYKTVECVGEEDIDGKPAYKVVLTPNAGTTVTAYFDKESGLLIRENLVAKTPQGDLPVEVKISEYKEVDGIKMPFQSEQTVLTQILKTTISEVTHDAEIPADRFEIPASIKKLIVD